MLHTVSPRQRVCQLGIVDRVHTYFASWTALQAELDGGRAASADHTAHDHVPQDGHAIHEEHAVLGGHVTKVDRMRSWPDRI